MLEDYEAMNNIWLEACLTERDGILASREDVFDG